MRGFLCAKIAKSRRKNEIKIITDELGDWWSHISSAVMFISMSSFEGQPNVVMEAIAGGCPVIVSDIPAHREFLCENSALIVGLEDNEELIEGILHTYTDRQSAFLRASKASERIRNMTDVVMAKKYDEVYSIVCSV